MKTLNSLNSENINISVLNKALKQVDVTSFSQASVD